MSSLGETPVGAPGERVLLHGLRLIDGTGRPPVPDAALLIEGEVIGWAGDAARLPADLGPVRRLDLAGRTLCPGFIDTHVHFALPGPAGNPLQGLYELPSYRTLKVLDRLRTTLENGVTTARDLMGLDAGFRQAVAERRIPGPRLLVSVTMLSQRAGHADFTLAGGIDGLAVAVTFPESPRSLVGSVDDMRARVRDLVAAGADCIKLATSGGVTSPHDRPEWLGLRPEMISAAVEEARAYGGLPVAAHAIGRPGIEAAVLAGVSSIEHGYALDEALRAEMVERGQFLVPTLLETTQDLDPARTSLGVREGGALAPDRPGVGGPVRRRGGQDRDGDRQRAGRRPRQEPPGAGTAGRRRRTVAHGGDRGRDRRRGAAVRRRRRHGHPGGGQGGRPRWSRTSTPCPTSPRWAIPPTSWPW